MIQAGDVIRFTGHGYRRAMLYGYAEQFGDREYVVKETRKSCCNRFLMLDGVEGMYCDVFFSKVKKK